MALKHQLINFFAGEPEEVILAMEGLRERNDGKGWMNLVPWLPDQDFLEMSQLMKSFSRKFLSSKGPEIPQLTWVPAYDLKRRVKSAKKKGGQSKPAQKVNSNLGVLHPKGRFASKQLAEAGISPPSNWILKQDHPKRGLIFEHIPNVEVELQPLLTFMVRVGTAFSGVPVSDKWVADILEQV